MKEQFTQGNWKAEKINPFCYRVYAGEHLVASIGSDGSVFCEADAHLIAAAPEMYNAMKMACEDCEKLSNWEDLFNIGRPEGSIMPQCPCDGCYVKEALMKVNSEVFQEIKKAKRIFSYSQEMYDMLSELVETVRAYGLEKKAAEIEKLLKKARGEE